MERKRSISLQMGKAGQVGKGGRNWSVKSAIIAESSEKGGNVEGQSRKKDI